MTVIVAEIGASHQQNLDKAKLLVRAAYGCGPYACGPDWIKLQTYTPDSISFRGAGMCPDGPWKGQPLYEIYDKAHMPRDMQRELIAMMNADGIRWFSTPFSPEDVQFLEDMRCPMYKVSSFDSENVPLVEAIRSTRRPVIFSDGMRTGLSLCRPGDTILRCVSEYPARPESYGLGARPGSTSWGVSDHTADDILGVVAIVMGASMIEKHVRLDSDNQSPDSKFATGLTEFSRQVCRWRDAELVAKADKLTVPSISAIMPRPVEIGGKTVWRRCVQ